jgi:hypothetical protein
MAFYTHMRKSRGRQRSGDPRLGALLRFDGEADPASHLFLSTL